MCMCISVCALRDVCNIRHRATNLKVSPGPAPQDYTQAERGADGLRRQLSACQALCWACGAGASVWKHSAPLAHSLFHLSQLGW